MATEEVRNPSYWWWVLSIALGIVGGLIAWGINRPKHSYMAKAMLLIGGLSTLESIFYSIA